MEAWPPIQRRPQEISRLNSAHLLCFICSDVIDVEQAVFVILSQYSERNEMKGSIYLSTLLLCRLSEEEYYSILISNT